MAKKVKCLVLLDEPAYELKCGQVVELEKKLADQLLKQKRIDTSPAAVGQGEPLAGPADAPAPEEESETPASDGTGPEQAEPEGD